MSQPQINFGSQSNQTVVSIYTRNVLLDILSESHLNACLITSTSRTPAEQASAMYHNIVATSVAAQKALYAAAGDEVIDVYVHEHANGKSPDQIKAAMEAKIIAIEPGKVSHHCADPTKLNVIDITPSSIADKHSFENVIAKFHTNGKISQWFSPRNGDPAYHLEIPQ